MAGLRQFCQCSTVNDDDLAPLVEDYFFSGAAKEDRMSKQVVKKWVEAWVVDFYLADDDGKPIGQPIDTQEVYRANAPTRWADNHAFRLKRQLQGAKITYSITKC